MKMEVNIKFDGFWSKMYKNQLLNYKTQTTSLSRRVPMNRLFTDYGIKDQKYIRKCQHWLVKRQAQLQTALGCHFSATREVKFAISDICADMMWHHGSIQGLLVEA